ncbi:MAG: NADH-quinone oxidoreductase subunit M, partial [Gammaproteobacteria bacterium]
MWLWFYNKHFEKITIVVAIFNVFLTILLLKNFDLTIYGWQFIEHYTMLPELGVCYSLGIDGLALSLITLSSLINLIIILSDFKSDVNCGKYKAYLLILNGMLNGVLSSTNAILFYIFFEGMLFPLFLIIGSSK